MRSSLVQEMVKRRLWPIPLIALAVAIAAPLLFLRPAADGAPPATSAAPPAAPGGALPDGAGRLLDASDAKPGIRRAIEGRSHDPFRAPASTRTRTASSGTAKKAGATASPSTSSSTSGAPIPVVITNSGPATAPQPATSSSGSRGTTPATKQVRTTAVDVSFGTALPNRVRRSIPRKQPFLAAGTVVAVFVRYSASSDKAIFAIGPRTHMTGDARCLRIEGLCRYVHLGAGQHVKLTTLSSSGGLVTRRLDVVRIDRTPSRADAVAVRSATARSGCRLEKLLELGATDPPLASDACKSS